MISDDANSLCHASVHQLARFLRAHADGENVRTLEALASAICNRVQRLLTQLSAVCRGQSVDAARAQMFITILEQMKGPGARAAQPDDAIYSCCLRVARRAMNGALRDPTRGATGFRKLGEPLPESLGSQVGVWIGSYVFFAEEKATFPQIIDDTPGFPLALV